MKKRGGRFLMILGAGLAVMAFAAVPVAAEEPKPFAGKVDTFVYVSVAGEKRISACRPALARPARQGARPPLPEAPPGG